MPVKKLLFPNSKVRGGERNLRKVAASTRKKNTGTGSTSTSGEMKEYVQLPLTQFFKPVIEKTEGEVEARKATAEKAKEPEA